MRCLSVVVWLWAGLGWGQTPAPTIAPFPLEVKRSPSNFTKKDGEELQGEVRRLLLKSNVLVPDSARLAQAMLELRRQDCEREDGCLQQLAQRAETLYALYVSLDYTVEQKVVASARVVRDDGKLVAGPRVVSLPRGGDAFRDVARVVLLQLFEMLGVRGLPPFRPVEPPSERVAPTEAPAPPVPPPVVVVEGRPVERTIGYVLVGVGSVALATGALVYGLTPRIQRDGDGNVFATQAPEVAGIQARQSFGVGLMVAGAVIGAGGAVLWGISGAQSQAPALSFAPVAGGAVVTVGGALP